MRSRLIIVYCMLNKMFYIVFWKYFSFVKYFSFFVPFYIYIFFSDNIIVINFYFSSSEMCEEISDVRMMSSLFPDQVDSSLALSFEVSDSSPVLSFEVIDSSEELFSLKLLSQVHFFCPNFSHFSLLELKLVSEHFSLYCNAILTI